jgi:hypothetical protein
VHNEPIVQLDPDEQFEVVTGGKIVEKFVEEEFEDIFLDNK